MLNLKVATIPNFQRTRGALRLLAAVVRQLWQNQPAQDLADPSPPRRPGRSQTIIEDLTSRLDRPKFKQVCEADIVSPQWASRRTQPRWTSPGGQRQATLCPARGHDHFPAQPDPGHCQRRRAAGADGWPSLTPSETSGDDPAVVKRALERLYDKAWFLEYDGYRYRFKTEPSLNKIVDDEMGAGGR